MNRVERWLIKQAYPEIDLDMVQVIYINSYSFQIFFDGEIYRLQKYLWRSVKRHPDKIYDDIHQVSIWIHFVKSENILLIKSNSLDIWRGREYDLRSRLQISEGVNSPKTN